MPINTTQTPVLAIDGGGTCCRFAIAEGDRRILFEGCAANVTTDFQGAVHCILKGLKTLAVQANVPIEELCEYPAFVGLAGVKSEATIARLSAELPLKNVCYTEDRLAAVRGALGKQDGFVVHCGTGSFFASQKNNQQRYAGGWGARLGDEASAYWVVQQALSLVLQQQDGFLSVSPLVTSVLEKFEDAQGIVTFANCATPAEFSQLAPLVTAHANRHDPIAVRVMQLAADYIVYGLGKLAWSNGSPICLSGGIGPECKVFLPADMQLNVAEPIGTPLDGAIQLALELR